MLNSYTAMIFSSLLLLGNAPSSQALMTGNEVEPFAIFFKESAQPLHGEATKPPTKGNRQNFVNTSCSFELDNQEICPYRGSGR